MNTAVVHPVSASAAPMPMPLRRVLRIYFAESKFESLRLLRAPTFVVPILLLPVLFYVFFGIFLGNSAVQGASEELFIGWTVYGVMGPALLTFGVVLAVERQYGLLTFKRALPMPPASYIVAKLLMALFFGVSVMSLLLAVALLSGQVDFNPRQIVAIAVVSMLGVPSACAIGLFIGVSASVQTAPAVANLVYFAMAGLSGLFSPLPASLQWLTPLWPSHHFKQLALVAAGLAPASGAWLHAGVLLAVTLFFASLAMRKLAKMGDRLT